METTNQVITNSQQLLKARIATLIVKGECTYKTDPNEVRQLLIDKYDVKPSLKKVEDELISLWWDSFDDQVAEIEEDFFEGY